MGGMGVRENDGESGREKTAVMIPHGRTSERENEREKRPW